MLLEKCNTSTCMSYIKPQTLPLIYSRTSHQQLFLLSSITNFSLLCNSHKHENVLSLSKQQQFLLNHTSPSIYCPILPFSNTVDLQKRVVTYQFQKSVLCIVGTRKKMYLLYQTHPKLAFVPTTALKVLSSRLTMASLLPSAIEIS